MLWPRAAKKNGNWHRGIVDAADRFMMRWHRGEAEGAGNASQQRTPRAATKGTGGAAGGRNCTDTAVDECRNEGGDRVARHQFE